MQTIKTLLIDDEFHALNLLSEYASRVPGIEVVGRAKTAIQAMELLDTQSVDLLFLDIQMPVLSGINFLKSLPVKPVTIFTTAYSEHAIEAYDLNVVDYLLKPYGFERFLQAVNKAKMLMNVALETPEVNSQTFIVVKVDGRLQKIHLAELLYVEGLREYVKLVCNNKHYITFERLKNIESALPNQSFMRVHKSYIVAKNAVQSIEGNLLELGKVKIPVSRDKKEWVVNTLFGV